jgi:hypothetical protein
MYISPYEAIFTLIREEKTEELAKLIATVPAVVGAKDARGSSPLLLATYLNNMSATRLLVEAGADLNLDAGTGTPLMGVCFKGYPEIAKYLVDAGADVNAVNPKAGTALSFAAMFNRSDIVEMLLARGADPSIKDGKGLTAADHATRQGFTEMAARVRV